MFNVNSDTMEITMHSGDTGSFIVAATKTSGTSWGENDRAVFTVKRNNRDVVIQRYYRLDTALGNGSCLIEFLNADTDSLPIGQYVSEIRYVIDAYWDGTAPTQDVVNALESEVHIIDGNVVRTAIQANMTINQIYGFV